MDWTPGTTDQHHVAQAPDAGADDYPAKPFRCGELTARLDVDNRIIISATGSSPLPSTRTALIADSCLFFRHTRLFQNDKK